MIPLVFLAIHAVAASPYSTLECYCPRACNVNVLATTCNAPIAINTTSFNNSNLDWMGAMPFVTSSSNVTLSAPSNIDCSLSFASTYNGSTQIAQRPLIQTSASSCEALVLPNETVNSNVTLFIGVRHLGSAASTVARLPPVGATLYTNTAPSVSLDGAHVIVNLVSLLNTYGFVSELRSSSEG